MATPDVSAVLVDTNVLLSATAPSRADHEAATRVLNLWPGRGVRLCTSGQILREYLVVATRPAELNGLELDVRQACENVSSIRARARYLDETFSVFARLAELVTRLECSGKQIHDANVVATALAHDVGAIVTANVGDFARFAERIELLDLAEA
jgi:predicted nucleic acid-binding protein